MKFPDMFTDPNGESVKASIFPFHWRCCVQIRLRLAAAKAKLQHLQPSAATTELGPSSLHFTNAQGQRQAPSRRLSNNQAIQSSANALNGIPHQAVYHENLPDPSISAMGSSQNNSGKATSQQRRRKVQEDSSMMDGKHAAKPHFAQTARFGRGRRGSKDFRGAECSAAILQDQSAQSHAGTEQDGLCEICMESPVGIVFQPCLHTVACAKCAEKIMARQNECPMCRAPLQAVMLLPKSPQRGHER